LPISPAGCATCSIADRMAIREARADEEGSVIGLWARCDLTRPWNDASADYRRALDWPGSTVLVAEHGRAIAGSVMVGHDGHRGWIYYLAVAPECSRAGLGRGLMAAAEAWLAERGCPKIQLMVREENDAAIAFYQALGLEVQSVVTLGRFLDPGR
jgi:ribosomal protein S18 acetylase RimI-like enzyme